MIMSNKPPETTPDDHGLGKLIWETSRADEQMTEPSPKYPDVEVPMSNEDGNAVAMVTRVVLAMRDDGVGRDEADRFRDEALSGDYDHVLDTIEKWVSVS